MSRNISCGRDRGVLQRGQECLSLHTFLEVWIAGKCISVLSHSIAVYVHRSRMACERSQKTEDVTQDHDFPSKPD